MSRELSGRSTAALTFTHQPLPLQLLGPAVLVFEGLATPCQCGRPLLAAVVHPYPVDKCPRFAQVVPR